MKNGLLFHSYNVQEAEFSNLDDDTRVTKLRA